MYQQPFTLGLSLASVIVIATAAFAETPKNKKGVTTIPLDQIWAVRMPGTRDIQKLSAAKKISVSEIRQAIGFPPRDKEADPGFAVLGTGLDALREAYAVFVEGKQRRDDFPANSQITVVFFTYETRPYVHLDKVERQGNEVNVYYKFVYHENEETERYVALIPLGQLTPGKYRVNIKRSVNEKFILRRISETDAGQIVCRSFSFTISEQGEEP